MREESPDRAGSYKFPVGGSCVPGFGPFPSAWDTTRSQVRSPFMGTGTFHRKNSETWNCWLAPPHY